MFQDLIQLALDLYEDGSHQGTLRHGDGHHHMRLHEFELLQCIFALMYPHLSPLKGRPL